MIKGERALRVFCASMADVFDNEVDQGHRAQLWALIRDTPALTWQILTKRIGNVTKMLPGDWGAGYSNVHLGISVVTQEEVERDVPKLLATPARVRFLSVEPMLEAINVTPWIGGREREISLVIAGGESGTKARPMALAWVRSLRDQCREAGVAFFLKQLSQANSQTFRDLHTFPSDLQIQEFPK